MALTVDVAPTILDLAGIPVPDVMQGRSLRPFLEGREVAWRDDWLYEHRFPHARIPKNEGVRTRRWKYVRFTEIQPLHEELYDLANDPREERNLAGDPKHAKRLAALRARCMELAKHLE